MLVDAEMREREACGCPNERERVSKRAREQESERARQRIACGRPDERELWPLGAQR